MSLDALKNEASDIDRDLLHTTDPEAAQQQEQAAAVDPVADAQTELRQILGMILPPLFAWSPSLKNIYSDDVMDKIALAGGPLAVKYGWNAGSFFSQYGEEIAFLYVVAPLAVPTYMAWKHDTASRKAKDVTPRADTATTGDGGNQDA